MATSAQTHFRSISLPSRTHPTHFESELRKLKSWRVSTPVGSQNIRDALLGLAELYSSIKELIDQSPSTQKSVILENGEESLEGSIQLLDSCSSIKELLQSMKENTHSLQSALRRKGLDSSIQNDVTAYFSFRKKMIRSIAKSLKTLKILENKKNGKISANADKSDFLNIVLEEVVGISIAIFKSVLVFLCGSMAKNRGWNLVVSKLMGTKSMASPSSNRDQSGVNEMDGVDLSLQNLNDIEFIQESLRNLEPCIEGFELGIDRLFRELIRCRVAFLNVVTHH